MGLGGGERREAGLDVRKVVKALEDSRRKRNRGHGLWWDGGILALLLTLSLLPGCHEGTSFSLPRIIYYLAT